MRPSPASSHLRLMAALAASVVCLATSCGGTYVTVAVKPDRWVCPGTPVTLSWQASRDPRITATPPVSDLTGLANVGSHPVSIKGTTHFLIQAGHWWWSGQTEADATVYDPALAQFPAGGASQLQFGKVGSEVGCSGDVAWAVFDQESDHWDPHLTVGNIRAVGNEKVSVWHAGIHAQVNSTPSTAFNGVSVQGVWLLETSCHPRPRVVGIELTATCNPNAPCGGLPQ
jgi:hypothetical protein